MTQKQAVNIITDLNKKYGDGDTLINGKYSVAWWLTSNTDENDLSFYVLIKDDLLTHGNTCNIIFNFQDKDIEYLKNIVKLILKENE